MRTRGVVVTVLAACMAVAGCGGGFDKAGGQPERQPKKLRLAVAFGEPTEVTGFAEEVNRLSHGALRITVIPRWRYGETAYENGLIGDVRADRADLGVAGSRAWDSLGVRSLRALSAPMLIDSYPLQERVLQSPMIAEMLRGLPGLGLVGLGVLPGELRRPLGVAVPLLGPSSYAGRRIGVQQSLLGSASLRALGATPVWFGGGASIAAFDGIEYDVSDIEGSGYDRVAKYLTQNVVLWPRPIVVFANQAVFARLTPAQQRTLTQAVSDQLSRQTTLMVGNERADTATLCTRGRLRFVAAAPADIAALRRDFRPVYAQLERDPQTQRFIARIEAIRGQVRAAASVVPSCSAGAPPGTREAATPADGTYALTVAPGDLAVSQRIPEAYGSWQIVLDQGWFRLTQRSDGAEWIADGRARIAGDAMSWTVTDIADMGPYGAPDGIPLASGETLRFRWQRSGSALELTAASRVPTLPALSVRPLVRTAAAPSQQPLENPAALQGSWASTPTAADVLAHHDDANGISDNTGPLRLTVHGNDCRWTQHAPDGDHWGVGTCRFAGDTIELAMARTDASGSPIPMYLHWSVFHDRLSFRRAPGFSPEAWAYEPWHKVG